VGLQEYDAALQWARLYGLNEDPVRQAQWRDADVTAASIEAYLAKVRGRVTAEYWRSNGRVTAQ
jgi:hypothetical protein